MTEVAIGLDVGTSNTKAVAVRSDGTVLARVRGEHGVVQPRPGWFEHDAEETWWNQSAALMRALTADEAIRGSRISAVAVSGLGPCVVPCDAAGTPLRPAILYGIDMRATAEIDELTERLGATEIISRGGSALSTQAIGPKLLWLQRNEPSVWTHTARWYTASSFIVARLTGSYVLDHHSASQCDPMYDMTTHDWAADWATELCPEVPLPELAWSDEVVGSVTPDAASRTGLPVGTPVLAGAVDAWAEAHSVGVRHDGDLMIMYGSTLFLVGVDARSAGHPGLWHTVGLTKGSSTLAAGMATSGLLATWVAETTARPIAELAQAAEHVAPGSEGLVILPYFAGERSPLFDPGARGVILGLTLAHTPAHLMRATYEAVAMGVRHNLEVFDSARARTGDWRAVAVGGGTAGRLWPQVVSDVTGRAQEVPAQTVGACYGDALLAATAVGMVPAETDWTKIVDTVEPRPELADLYERRYALYRDLYSTTRPLLDRM